MKTKKVLGVKKKTFFAPNFITIAIIKDFGLPRRAAELFAKTCFVKERSVKSFLYHNYKESSFKLDDEDTIYYLRLHQDGWEVVVSN